MSEPAKIDLEALKAQLPPLPWSYMPDKYDDWGTVRDAEGHPVANTCPPGVAQEFQPTPWNSPERKAGPPKARAIAMLLIQAPSLIAEVERLRGAETKLREALLMAAPEFCGSKCPSVKYHNEPWEHCEKCKAIQAALGEVGSGNP